MNSLFLNYVDESFSYFQNSPKLIYSNYNYVIDTEFKGESIMEGSFIDFKGDNFVVGKLLSSTDYTLKSTINKTSSRTGVATLSGYTGGWYNGQELWDYMYSNYVGKANPKQFQLSTKYKSSNINSYFMFGDISKITLQVGSVDNPEYEVYTSSNFNVFKSITSSHLDYVIEFDYSRDVPYYIKEYEKYLHFDNCIIKVAKFEYYGGDYDDYLFTTYSYAVVDTRIQTDCCILLCCNKNKYKE